MLDAEQLADAYGRVTPDVKTATMKSRKAGAQQATFTDYAIASVRLKKLSKSQFEVVAAADGAAFALRARVLQTWEQHLTEAGAPEPKALDQWTVEGVTWTVKEVLERKMMGEVTNLLVFKNAGT